MNQYPNGRLNAQDEGQTAMKISTENGCVRIDFPSPVTWLAMPPQQAVQLAVLLMKRAQALGAGTLSIEIPSPGPGEKVN